MSEPTINVPPFCKTHLSLLVHGAGFKESDPWRALTIMASIALFQAATADPTTYDRVGGDVTRIPELGCLACYKPDAFGEIVEAVRTRGLSAIKPLGESWVAKSTSPIASEIVKKP